MKIWINSLPAGSPGFFGFPDSSEILLDSLRFFWDSSGFLLDSSGAIQILKFFWDSWRFFWILMDQFSSWDSSRILLRFFKILLDSSGSIQFLGFFWDSSGILLGFSWDSSGFRDSSWDSSRFFEILLGFFGVSSGFFWSNSNPEILLGFLRILLDSSGSIQFLGFFWVSSGILLGFFWDSSRFFWILVDQFSSWDSWGFFENLLDFY